MNRLRIILLLATATAGACGGDDTGIPDGGGDATTETGGGDSGKDSPTTTDAPVADSPTTDAPTTDAPVSDGAPSDAATFTCGTTSCDSNTQYCEKAQKGPDAGLPDAAKLDSGTIEVDTCLPYPNECTADGGTPSCACITTTCTCAQSGSDITVTCP